MSRFNGRNPNQMRDISFELSTSKYAEGSCIVKCGNTHVLCTASVDEKVPSFIKNSGKGWLTAEYAMLPRSTHTRVGRDRGMNISGRTQEIQRLIGRVLRSACNLNALGERQIMLDCDVLSADGGTRTASINGAFVSLHLACAKLLKSGAIRVNPCTKFIGAISCGISSSGEVFADLDYNEDSSCIADCNFVLDEEGSIVEVQATGEGRPIKVEEFTKMLEYAKVSISEIIKLQKQVLCV